MRHAVIGSGSWGTALAFQLAASGDEVRVWDRDTDRAAEHNRARRNLRYLPDIELPPTLSYSGDIEHVLDGSGVVLSVVPAQATRAVWAEHGALLGADVILCSASKGIEQGTLATVDEILHDVLPERLHTSLCHLAGPSFAREVALGLPTAVVVAGRHDAEQRVAEALHGGAFRVYHTDDVVGAELGGALKNVVAIACGTADGCNFGLNARAALITRGLAEITRLAVARGANPLTLMGLAGMGDLVLTCTGDLSRNRRVGLGLGEGKTLPQILDELGQVAEGVYTAQSAFDLAARTGVEMPITQQIHAMLYQDKPVREAMTDLLSRERRAERG